MIFIGIDCGLTGAIAVIGEYTNVIDMPTEDKGGSSRIKRRVDPVELRKKLEMLTISNSCKTIAFIENVWSGSNQGVASVFSLGDTFGCIRGVCAAMGFTVELVSPQSWKGYFGLTGKAVEKDDSRLVAMDMYPEMPLTRKKDHDRAEALLIATYGKAMYSKE